MDTSWITEGDDRIPPAMWTIAVAGTVPVWGAALVLWSDIDTLTAHRIVAAVIAYGALVLAFLGGTRWAMALTTKDSANLYRERALAILPGFGGFVALFLPPAIAVTLLISLFLSQALWDLTSAEAGHLSPWSAVLRIATTAIAVPAIVIVLAWTVTAG